MLWSEEWARRHEPMAVDPRESRARRSPARGGVQPSSEAESRPRGVQPSSEAEFWCYSAGPLERGGVLLEGCRGRLLAGPLVSSGP
jgi:hypothetical protein